MIFFIYGLKDPVTGEIRYVGGTVNPVRRLAKHLLPENDNPEKGAWIASLKAQGLKPLLVILEETDDREREWFWIAHGRSQGWPLLNLNDGGKHGHNPSTTTLKRLRRVKRGKTPSQRILTHLKRFPDDKSLSCRALARKLNVSHRAVSRVFKKLNIEVKNGKKGRSGTDPNP